MSTPITGDLNDLEGHIRYKTSVLKLMAEEISISIVLQDLVCH